MILNENEVKTCLIYTCHKYLKDFEILESSLMIADRIFVQAKVRYQERTFDLVTSFLISYRNKKLYFEEVQGQVEFVFLKMKVVKLLDQLVHDSHFHCYENECVYDLDLPIQSITIQPQQLHIQLV